ncbi:MAG: hypothetical protein IH955_04770 [Chloroflexi bacterium]|nr:hypothetical protein [Chloroflexota bacterium]
MDELNGTKKELPIYVSYLTFTTFLDWLGEMEPIPATMDRSLWSAKFSGTNGAQLMVGLRFLGLLKGDTTTSELNQLATANDQERMQLLKVALEQAYGDDLLNNLPVMTPKKLEDALTELGATGATHRKAISFLVNACKAVGVNVPKAISKRARNKPTRKRSSKPEIPAGTPPVDNNGSGGNSDGKQQGEAKTVELKSGGIVTLLVDIDPFGMSQDDRRFVFDLIDKLAEYSKVEPVERVDPELTATE